MNHSFMQSIGSSDLRAYGIRPVYGDPVLRSRACRARDVLLLSISGPSTELHIDTTSMYPEHALFAFITARTIWSRPPHGPWARDSLRLVIAPHGLVRDVHWHGPWQITAILIPRSAIDPGASPLPQKAIAFANRKVLDASVQRFADVLLNSDLQASVVEQCALEQLLLDMCGALLTDRIGEQVPQSAAHAALRNSAISVIAHQCGDPTLTPSRVARQVQFSLRQLQLVFTESGNTIAGEIRHQRARRAHSFLIDPRYAHLSIDQVAQHAGFPSTTSLRRAISQAYATTPRTLRTQAGIPRDAASRLRATQRTQRTQSEPRNSDK